MQPTMKLRWKILPGRAQDMQPILQQWWEGPNPEKGHAGDGHHHNVGEWRNVISECCTE